MKLHLAALLPLLTPTLSSALIFPRQNLNCSTTTQWETLTKISTIFVTPSITTPLPEPTTTTKCNQATTVTVTESVGGEVTVTEVVTQATTLSETQTVTATATSSCAPLPSPIQPGTVWYCKQYHLVTAGQDCAGIAAMYGALEWQFHVWNPEVGGTGCLNLWLGYYVCVGI